MTQTRNQMRATALGAARYTLRRIGRKPLTASTNEALGALASYARKYRNMNGSQWYHSATEAEIAQFCQDWRAWQRRMATLVQLPGCRVHTRNSVVFLAVHLLPSGVEGFVMIADEETPVYVVDGSRQYEWATSQHDASYLAARLNSVR
jgi:hypothetical protein